MSAEQAVSTSVQNTGPAVLGESNGVVLYPINAGNEPGLRSLNSKYATKVSFINLRSTAVHLWWLNFEGKRVSYGTVQPYHRHEMNTFETHPWVIVDESSKKALGIWLPVSEKGLVLIF